MVSVVESSPWAALIVLILTSPKIIRAIATLYVAIKRVNFETKEKRPPRQ